MNGQILVVGSLNMDLVVTADHLPVKGETVIEGLFDTYPGGKGANQAVAAARMGGRVKMLGRVGRDTYGRQLIDGLEKDHIDIRPIRMDEEHATGVAVITVDKNGQNTIVVASGANMALTVEDITNVPDLFTGVSVVVAQLEIPVPVVVETFRIAKKLGSITLLNPAPARRLPAELFPLVDYILPNRLELAMLTGVTMIHEGISRLHEWGTGTIIVTQGEEGALLATREKTTQVPAFTVEAVDTVAAGDAFAGALAVGLSEGMSVENAANLASAAAAISVTRRGAQPSLPCRVEVDAFLL